MIWWLRSTDASWVSVAMVTGYRDVKCLLLFEATANSSRSIHEVQLIMYVPLVYSTCTLHGNDSCCRCLATRKILFILA